MATTLSKQEVIQKFFSSFGIPAYASTGVPVDAELPYITYETVVGAFDNEPVTLTANIWYRSESEAEPNRKAEEISKAVGLSGVTKACDGGLVWFKKGSPWCQSLSEQDKSIKRRYLNFEVEFLTFS